MYTDDIFCSQSTDADSANGSINNVSHGTSSGVVRATAGRNQRLPEPSVGRGSFNVPAPTARPQNAANNVSHGTSSGVVRATADRNQRLPESSVGRGSFNVPTPTARPQNAANMEKTMQSASTVVGSATTLKRKANGTDNALINSSPLAKKPTTVGIPSQTSTQVTRRHSEVGTASQTSTQVTKRPFEGSASCWESAVAPSTNSTVVTFARPVTSQKAEITVLCTADPQFEGRFLPHLYLSESGTGKPKSHIRCIRVFSADGKSDLITPSEVLRRSGVFDKAAEWSEMIKLKAANSPLSGVLRQLDALRSSSQDAAAANRTVAGGQGGPAAPVPSLKSSLELNHTRKLTESSVSKPGEVSGVHVRPPPAGNSVNVPSTGSLPAPPISSGSLSSVATRAVTSTGVDVSSKSNVTVSSGSQPQVKSNESQVTERHLPEDHDAYTSEPSSVDGPVSCAPAGQGLAAGSLHRLGNLSVASNILNPIATHMQVFYDGVHNAAAKFTESIEEEAERAKKALTSFLQREHIKFKDEIKEREAAVVQREQAVKQREQDVEQRKQAVEQREQAVKQQEQGLAEEKATFHEKVGKVKQIFLD